jgi:iron complex outermembrane receptor protein
VPGAGVYRYSESVMKRTFLSTLIGIALASASGYGMAQNPPPPPPPPPPAQPDQQTPPEKSSTNLETITVTGSALPRVDVETPSPVAVITAVDIERSGLKTVGDVVRAISADNSGSIPNSFTAGFAAGSAGVALRGLTVNSTLVLIDGRRSANYALADDGQRSFVDLNTIPVNAIERIDVLKDGASSLYGADAIAGVVNVIMKPNFKGAEGTLDIGTSQHGGGFTRRVTGIFGGGDMQKDGHNGYISVEYQKDNAISVRDRDFPFNTADLSSIGGVNGIGGQPSTPSGSIYGTVTPGTLLRPGDLTSGVPNDGAVSQVLNACGPGSTFINNDPNNPGSYCRQNFALYGDVQAEQERANVYGRFTIKLNEDTTAYLSASYYQNETTVRAPPTQINVSSPNNTNAIALPPTLPDGSLNPNNPFAASGQYALINYAFPGINAGAADLKNHNARVAGGVKGRIGDWDYDSGIVLNHTWLNVTNYGFLNFNQLITAITNGTYNFLNPSANSQASLNALAPPLSKVSTTNMDSIDFRASRSLMDLRGGELGLGLGGEWRYESQNDTDLNPNGAAQGLGIAHTIGRRNVFGAYAELDAPLLENLEMNLSGRYDHYSDSGSNFSPKFGVKWKPFEQLAIRGTYSKGFRAPGFAENGSSAAGGFVVRTPPVSFQQEHNFNGYVRPFPLELLSAGNPDIKPEKARSYTFGLIYQPTPELSASLDYYDIKKDDVIQPQSASAALAAYYARQPLPVGTVITVDNPDPEFPNALPRPVIVAAGYVNESSLRTKGVDLNLIGNFDFNGTKWISQISATDIFTWKVNLADGTTQQFVGTQGPYALSSGAGTPRLRGSWANTLIFGPATITATVYYTSGLYMSTPDQSGGVCASVNTTTGANFPANCRMPSSTYVDLTGSYDISERITLTGSIQNLFDRDPAFDPLNYAALNYNPTYGQEGIVGRFFNLGVKVKLD